MIKINENLIANLESNNIENIIPALDDLVEQMTLLLRKSLISLDQNIEWRLFITERIYKIIKNQKFELENFYSQEKVDTDMNFWLSTILVEYHNNSKYINDILEYVKSHDDENVMLALNILVRYKVEGLDEIIINKLTNLNFTIDNFDKINYYLDKVKTLNTPITKSIIEKINAYNESVEFEWEKLIVIE